MNTHIGGNVQYCYATMTEYETALYVAVITWPNVANVAHSTLFGSVITLPQHIYVIQVCLAIMSLPRLAR